MNCEQVDNELVAYQFGEVDEDTRRRVESHMLECRGCLQSFFDLKRDMEAADQGPEPSALLHRRLRRAVAVELGLTSRPWHWWERPLAFALAGGVVFAALVAVNTLAAQPGSLPHGWQDAPSGPSGR